MLAACVPGLVLTCFGGGREPDVVFGLLLERLDFFVLVRDLDLLMVFVPLDLVSGLVGAILPESLLM